MTVIAICLAVLAAVGLAVGALLQHRAVNPENSSGTLGFRGLIRLFANPVWLLGLAALTLGTVANVAALALSAVIVVQPIGAISLVISVLLGIRYRGLVVGPGLVPAVIGCMLGVAGFVSISAAVSESTAEFGADARILAIAGLAVACIGLGIILLIRRPHQLLLITGGGILFAFCATNVHVLSTQLLGGTLGAGSILNAIALAAAAGVGSWFVQAAYAAGPPELVIAGLTVIDPIVAVLLGAIILGEAAGASGLVVAGMVACGALACASVGVLSRYHPEARERRAKRRELTADEAETETAPR